MPLLSTTWSSHLSPNAHDHINATNTSPTAFPVADLHLLSQIMDVSTLGNFLLLSSSFRTGNPIIDSLLLLLATSAVGYVAQHAKTFFAAFRAKVLEDNHSKMFIESLHERSHHNQSFVAFRWYLSTLKDKARCLDASQTWAHDALLISIAKNSSQTIQHEGEEILVEYVYEKNTTDTRQYIVLTYKGVTSNYLPDFLTYVTKQHKQFTETAEWKQTLWYLERCDGTLAWTGYEAGNNKHFSNIIMDVAERDALEEDVQHFLDSEADYIRRGVSWSRGYLFYGAPGCGKTSLVKAISNKAQMDVYCMDFNILLSDQELRSVFRKIPVRSLLSFEDVDALSNIVRKRTDADGQSNGASYQDEEEDNDSCNAVDSDTASTDAPVDRPRMKSSITLSALLNELDGLATGQGRILVMTTNHLDALDPALIRPGRIDKKKELKRATRSEIALAIELYLDQKVQLEQLGEDLEGRFTKAEICNKIVTGELVVMDVKDVVDYGGDSAS